MEQFARDTKLVFENAILYNGENSEVGELAQSMLNNFDSAYNTLVQGKPEKSNSALVQGKPSDGQSLAGKDVDDLNVAKS